MKAMILRQKSKEELQHLLEELRKKSDRFRFQRDTKKIKNVKELREVKKDIARIYTLLRNQ